MFRNWSFSDLLPSDDSGECSLLLCLTAAVAKLIYVQPMTYFRKRRAIAGGLAIAGSSLGGVIFPIMVTHLLPKIGFSWTMRTCAFLILGLLLITNMTISSNLQHSPQPFKVGNYLRPLRETNFQLMCIGSFFLYCKRNLNCFRGRYSS